MPANARLWELLRIMSSQWLCSPGGSYGLNMTPVLLAARELGMTIDMHFLERVKAFEATALGIINKTDKACTPEKRRQCEAEFGTVHLDWICKTCEEMKNK